MNLIKTTTKHNLLVDITMLALEANRDYPLDQIDGLEVKQFGTAGIHNQHDHLITDWKNMTDEQWDEYDEYGHCEDDNYVTYLGQNDYLTISYKGVELVNYTEYWSLNKEGENIHWHNDDIQQLWQPEHEKRFTIRELQSVKQQLKDLMGV